jgi:hypothetical protein
VNPLAVHHVMVLRPDSSCRENGRNWALGREAIEVGLYFVVDHERGMSVRDLVERYGDVL